MKITAGCSSVAEEKALRECLDSFVKNLGKNSRSIVRVHRRPSGAASWYASEVLTVELSTREEFQVFMKDFGKYERPKEDMKGRRERERYVYKDVLSEADLGTAGFYGSVWDESAQRFWLLLEFIVGTPVRYCSFEHWISAVEWLGKMHAHYAERADHLEQSGFLTVHNQKFFWDTAKRALLAVSSYSDDLSFRLEEALRRYGSIVDMMAGQARTLVHGSYGPKQVLVNPGESTYRVCPLDWELAGVGSGWLDLAFFVDGFSPPQSIQLLNAYVRQVAGTSLIDFSTEQCQYLINCFRFHKILNWLSQSEVRGFPMSDVEKLVEMVARMDRLLATKPVPGCSSVRLADTQVD